MLTPEQAIILEKVWRKFLHDNFPGELKSNAPAIYVRSKAENFLHHIVDKEAVEIGEKLYRYINNKLKASPKYDFRLYSKKGKLMETVSWLLEDYPESPACAYSNLECVKHTPWKDYKFLHFLRQAEKSLSIIQTKGGDVSSLKLDDVRESIKQRQAFSDYIAEAEDRAEYGEIMEDLRDLIDGYDHINEKMGSFHDSELSSMIIDHEGNYIELKLHMCNGADGMLTLRFEGHIEYEIAGDGDCMCLYLYGGYFYRSNNRVCLDLDPLGVIEADNVRVISFSPYEGENI